MTNITFGNDISDAARNIFLMNIRQVEKLLQRDNISSILNCNIQFLQYIGNDAKRDISGEYNSIKDQITISMIYGMTLQNTYNDVILHELGHRFYTRVSRDLAQDQDKSFDVYWAVIYNRALKSNQKIFPSRYSKTNPIEFWAECFRYHFTGHLKQVSPKLDNVVKTMIKQYGYLF